MRGILAASLLLLAASAQALVLPFGPNNLDVGPMGGGDRAEAGGIPIPSVDVAAVDVHEPGAAADAVVTYAAVLGRHCISGIAWSYSAAPTGGQLTVTDGASVVFRFAITAAGPGSITFPVAKRGTHNTAMIVSLASGAGAVVGKVSVLNHWIEFPE